MKSIDETARKLWTTMRTPSEIADAIRAPLLDLRISILARIREYDRQEHRYQASPDSGAVLGAIRCARGEAQKILEIVDELIGKDER